MQILLGTIEEKHAFRVNIPSPLGGRVRVRGKVSFVTGTSISLKGEEVSKV